MINLMQGVWKPDVKGQFSVKSFYNVLNDISGLISGWKSFWDPSVPPRVLAFCLVGKKHKILTIDKLRRRNRVIINGCPTCLKEEETVHHLFIHCQFACKVWYFVLQCFDMNWVMPRTVE